MLNTIVFSAEVTDTSPHAGNQIDTLTLLISFMMGSLGHKAATPPIPQSALKVLQKFLVQKLSVINFEDISNNFQITFQRETSKVIQNLFKSTSKVF